jgi:2'-5' RNA ligase
VRLFFALWPAPATQHAWHHDLAPYLDSFGGHRVPAANLHLTLAFLGELPGHRMNDLLRLGDDLPTDAITLRFDRIESWKSARVACLRPAETPAALTRLAGQLHTGLHMAGVAPEARHFRPHVTLARQATVPAAGLPVWPVVEWQVPAIALVRSRLLPAGSEYAVLQEWPLG